MRMASTLTRRNAEISFKALSLGAADYIPKPESTREATAAETFHHDLIQKIRHLGARARRRASPAASPSIAPAPERARGVSVQPVAAPAAQLQLARQPFSMLAPRVLLIGSSTGGPQALMTLVADIGPVIDRFPVLITQHMPPTFTTILAEHLARSSRRPAHEAVDGERVKPGQIYIAPGGRHMRVVRHSTEVAIALDDGPPVNFCKPAVDPLFISAIDVWQAGTLAVILTGMWHRAFRWWLKSHRPVCPESGATARRETAARSAGSFCSRSALSPVASLVLLPPTWSRPWFCNGAMSPISWRSTRC